MGFLRVGTTRTVSLDCTTLQLPLAVESDPVRNAGRVGGRTGSFSKRNVMKRLSTNRNEPRLRTPSTINSSPNEGLLCTRAAAHRVVANIGAHSICIYLSRQRPKSILWSEAL